MRISALVPLIALSAACSRDVTDASNLVSAHDVSINATVVGLVASGDSVTIRISNTGNHTAYVSRCGSGPLVLMQLFVGGAWTGGVQNFMCLIPTAPGPVEIAAGSSVDIARVFSAKGRYRFIAGIAGSQDLSDVTMATSNGFDIP